jgi:hypothetical protein
MLTWFVACTGAPDPVDTGPEDVPVGPDLVIDTDTLSFSSTIGLPTMQAITMTNAGDELLRLEFPVLEDDTSTFELGDLATIYLRPGDTWPLEIIWTPDSPADASGSLVLASNDADEPVQEVLLVGTTLAPEVVLAPEGYDFGTLEAWCTDSYGFVISNSGDADLTISGVEAEGGDAVFSVELETPLPWTLGPGEQQVARAVFAPTLEGEYAGSLTVESDDPTNPTAAATLDGAGTDNRRIDDNFVTLGRSVDILFAVGGADADTLSDDLQAGLTDLLTPLDAANVDYTVSAVRADDGCLVNALQVTATMTADEQATAFAGMFDTTGTLHTLTLLERALAESTVKGCNPDVVRPDARLLLVGLTDEASAAPQASGVYVSTFQGMKSDPDDVEAWAIAPDGTCGDPDDAWLDVTASTGGTYASVCDDLATTLAALGEAGVARQTSYPLSAIPWTDTLVVSVDGDWTWPWTYDATDNAVVFDDADAPEVGAAVRAVYWAVPVCP